MWCEVVVEECNVVDFELGIVLMDDEAVELESDEGNNILVVAVQELLFHMSLEDRNVEVVRRQIDVLMPFERSPLMTNVVPVVLLLEMETEGLLHIDYPQVD